MTECKRARQPRVAVLAGDPAQMGLAHGRLLSREIRFLVEQMRHHIFRRVGPIRGAGLQIAARALSLAMDRHIPLHLKGEMKAIAQGSGVAYSELLLMNTLDDVLNVLRRLAPRAPKLGCSSFALIGNRCRDGTVMHGRNLDYHFRGTPLEDHGAVARLLSRESLVFVHRPRDRTAFLSIGWPGLVGVTTAISQEGISLGNLTSYLPSTAPNGTPSALLYRRLVEEASTLHDVDSLLRASRRTIGNSLMVGSGRENSAALFEITSGAVEQLLPESGILVATNHFLSPQLALRQRPYLPAHSLDRWKRLLALCNRYEAEVADALAFLGDVGHHGEENAENPFARVANEGTAVSVLFQPAELRLWLATREAPPTSRGKFLPIDVRELLTLSPGVSTLNQG